MAVFNIFSLLSVALLFGFVVAQSPSTAPSPSPASHNLTPLASPSPSPTKDTGAPSPTPVSPRPPSPPPSAPSLAFPPSSDGAPVHSKNAAVLNRAGFAVASVAGFFAVALIA